MRSINVLTINEEPKNESDMVRIVEEAGRCFPSETWSDVKYLGKLNLEHDVKIASNRESFGAFIFDKLIGRIKRVQCSYRLLTLLLGITTNPIIAMHYFFDGKRFKRTHYLVHDYMAETIGVVSLFRVKDKFSSKVVAHGLGHSRGLRHHTEPIDIMYFELSRFPQLRVKGFCYDCLSKLKTDKMEM